MAVFGVLRENWPDFDQYRDFGLTKLGMKIAKHVIQKPIEIVIHISLGSFKPIELPNVSKICAIPKRNKNKEKPSHYRPISRTCHFLRILGQMILGNMLEHLKTCKLEDAQQ